MEHTNTIGRILLTDFRYRYMLGGTLHRYQAALDFHPSLSGWAYALSSCCMNARNNGTTSGIRTTF